MSIDTYAALSKPIYWEPVTNTFKRDAAWSEQSVSNISLIPRVGDKYVVMQLADGRWELIGGTLEPGEYYMDGLRRELLEEIGAELIDFELIGYFDCHSHAEKPYRPHIPHPDFIRLVGCGEVRLVCQPLNPPDGEQVAKVELVTADEASRRFQAQGRPDIAELYQLAHASCTSA